MRIVVYLQVADLDEAVRAAEALAPYRERVLRFGDVNVVSLRARADARQQRIMQYFPPSPMIMGRLWRHLRGRQVYGASYKSFQRDVYDLVVQGRLVSEPRVGGPGNTVSFR